MPIDLEGMAALGRKAEVLRQETQDLIDQTQDNLANSRELISRAEELVRDLCDRINATRDRLASSLYSARIADVRRGDLVKIDCVACHHVTLFTPAALLKLGLSPVTKLVDLKGHLRCRGCGAKGGAVVSIKWGRRTG